MTAPIGDAGAAAGGAVTGTTQAVGNVVGTASPAAGKTVGTAGKAAGDTVAGVTKPVDDALGGLVRRPQASGAASAPGASSRARIAARKRAASAPWRIRWSQLSVSVIAPSLRTAPTASAAAWGGAMTALKPVTPNMPRLDTVNVPARPPAG